MERKPLCIDLFCGLFGWGSAFAEEGYDVIGFDIQDMCKTLGISRPAGCHLVVQDARTLHGSQFKDASVIVSSSPCTEFSWMAMPWKRAKQVARAFRGQDEFPPTWKGSRTIDQLTELFYAQFRIQREASEAAGHPIPLVAENVLGAAPWVGRSRANYGPYHLYGDVPALMPIGRPIKVQNFRFDGSGRSFQSAAVRNMKLPDGVRPHSLAWGNESRWFNDGPRSPDSISSSSSSSPRRKAASAQIAKIPPELARHIARVYHPRNAP